jgi:ribonuclease HI
MAILHRHVPMTDPHCINNHSNFQILQNNLNHNSASTNSILNHPDSSQYTLLLLQEQYCPRNTLSSPIHPSWTLIEPTVAEPLHPRVAIYVNNRLIPSSIFAPIHFPFRDVIAVAIKTERSNKPMLIINIYNPHDYNLINPLREYLQQHIRAEDYENIIMAGDFNLHHPLWNPREYTTHDHRADVLIEMMADYGLRLLLPSGTITFPRNGTSIDLVWGNEATQDVLLKCQVSAENDHGSDHLPIESVLDLTPHLHTPSQLPYNYAKTNWSALEDRLTGLLPQIIDCVQATPAMLDQYAEDVVNALTTALAETTPRKKLCPFSKRWWNDSLTQLRREVNRKRNLYRRTRNEREGAAWRSARDEYRHEIKRAKERMWRQFIEDADERTIWTAKKYLDSMPTPHYIPTLNDNANSNEEKAAEFQANFFPLPPPADLSDIPNVVYPSPVPCEIEITMTQIERAVNKMAPNKAPGPDEISNLVVKKTFNTTQQHILALAKASFNIAHFPKIFKRSTTVILRKPSKPDYTKPNAYRPIALESTIGKILESVAAEILSYLSETYELLPVQHFGGRPGRTAEDAMTVLSERIYHAWKEREIYSAVFMDVAGAFNNVHHERLVNNMKQRRIPRSFVKWTESFLKDRSTQLRFNGTTTEAIMTRAGVPQGSPLSPLLYMFYNGDLLEIPQKCGLRLAQSLGFIDDIAYGVQGPTDEDNAETLEHLLHEAEQWRSRHGVKFEKSKYILVHFTRNNTQRTTSPVTVGEVTIQPSNEARYLGVIFDRKLKYQSHIQYVAKKGCKFALAISRVARSTWGAHYRYARQLFTAVVAPRMDYAASIWHRPLKYGKTHAPTQLSKFASAQRIAMKAIIGCFRTTPTPALEVETALSPAHIRLQSKILRTFTRMQTLVEGNPVSFCIERAIRSKSNKVISNLEYIARSFPEYANTEMEKIKPFIRPPWWATPVHIHLDTSKKEAKNRHDSAMHDQNTVCIYTDGSGIDGQIGAAAYCPTLGETKQQYLGTESLFNVYVAEVTAMTLAIEILQSTERRYNKCVIYADSQPAIKAIAKPARQSGQAIIQETLDAIESFQSEQPNLTVSLEWVPGHVNIKGNEKADEAAKEAAKSLGRAEIAQFKHKALKSSRDMIIKKNALTEWTKAWQSGKENAMHLRRITKRPKIESGPKLYNNITTRPKMATLARLRTGHCSLNQYLYRIGVEESPRCAQCTNGGIEDVEHFLVRCTKHERERAALIKNVGIGGMEAEKLLGDPDFIKHTLDFVEKVARFSS